MTMNSRAALSALREKAAEFDFPVLDNANWDFVAGRMRGFRQGTEWALTFEMLIFQVPARDFCTTVYSYGSLPGTGDGYSGSISVVEELPDHPLWDDDGEWIAGCRERTVTIHGEPVVITVGAGLPDTLLSAGQTLRLSHGDDADEATFLRSLTRELGLKQMMPEADIFKLLPSLQDAVEVIRLTNWDHPDVAGEQTPADSHAVSAAVAFLCGEAPGFSYDHSHDNVDWRQWIFE